MIREIYGKKIGMTQVFDQEGNLLATTLIEVEPVYLLEKVEYPTKTKAKIGCFKIEETKIGKVKRPVKGYFNKLKVSPYKLIREVTIDKDFPETDEESKEKATIDPRQFGVEIFEVGSKVDVRAKTKGRGFAGGMKRHGWSGQPGSHGHTTHRRLGSAGASAYPSRIIKGLNMPGHMGNCFRTTKNLKVLKVDKEKNLLFIEGNIPGARGAVVRVRKVDKNHG
ncbi:MAG: 50S ribosomal protein L3 [Candidatus Omnitrophota bacterium]